MSDIFVRAIHLVDGLTGILTAAVAFIAAVYALRDLIRKHRKVRREQPRARAKHTINLGSLSALIISLAILGGVIYVRFFLPDATFIAFNQKVTSDAWLAFEKGQQRFLKDQHIERPAFEEAIKKAKFVVAEFSGVAANQQAGLIQSGAALPPIGPVPNDQRARIFALGLINDVGTCHYIIGRSFEYLEQLKEARAAYEAATNYPHARAWDQRGSGFFWSTADAASGRLVQISK